MHMLTVQHVAGHLALLAPLIAQVLSDLVTEESKDRSPSQVSVSQVPILASACYVPYWPATDGCLYSNTPKWTYNSLEARCEQVYPHDCLDQQLNMYGTEQDCRKACPNLKVSEPDTEGRKLDKRHETVCAYNTNIMHGPLCANNGFYNLIQCDPSARYGNCWCVDPVTGTRQFGTVFSMAAHGRVTCPNCNLQVASLLQQGVIQQAVSFGHNGCTGAVHANYPSQAVVAVPVPVLRCSDLLVQWSAWGQCSQSCGRGHQTRSRVATNFPGSLSACPILSEMETQSCTERGCAEDCIVSGWSGWTSCSRTCSYGTQQRTRQIQRYPSNGGRQCGSTNEVRDCSLRATCAVDCAVTGWSGWSSCSARCGGGSQTRSRTIIQSNRDGGQECPALGDIQLCNTRDCPTDCVVSEWQAWDICSRTCGTGSQHRMRFVVSEPTNGGAPCPPTNQVQQCNKNYCAVNCQVTAWSGWSSCSSSCGSGYRSHTRSIVQNSQSGGLPCPVTSETETCNDRPCAVDCQLAGWSGWSSCSVSCSNGIRQRSRLVLVPARNGGYPCAPTNEVKTCNAGSCAVNCALSGWASWTACTRHCGGGTQSRTRYIARQPMYGGYPCVGGLSQLQACNMVPCGGLSVPSLHAVAYPAQSQFQPSSSFGSTNDCVVTHWSGWSSCSTSCGSGLQTRTRIIVQYPSNTGYPCPVLTDSSSCNRGSCFKA